MSKRVNAAIASSLLVASLLLPTTAFGQRIQSPQSLAQKELARKACEYAEAAMQGMGVPDFACSSTGLAAESSADPYGLADELRKAGKNDEALQAINEALRRDPNRGAAYGLRSGILGSLGQYPDGAADGDLGIKLSKTARDKAMSAYNKCFNLTELGKKREALGACSLSVQLDGTYARAHFGAGKLYYYLGMWKEAGRALDRAVQLSPKLAAAWAYRAEVHFQLGDISRGMVAAETAVELGPNDPRSFRARAIGFQKSKRFEEMLADATTALEMQPNRPLAHLLRGQALGLLGRLDFGTREERPTHTRQN